MPCLCTQEQHSPVLVSTILSEEKDVMMNIVCGIIHGAFSVYCPEK
jgi:hypothetical protein